MCVHRGRGRSVERLAGYELAQLEKNKIRASRRSDCGNIHRAKAGE